MILLLLVLILGYISGYFYPTQYLPEALRSVGDFLPTRYIFAIIRDAITGGFAPATMLISVVYAAVLDVVSVSIDSLLRVRRWSW